MNKVVSKYLPLFPVFGMGLYLVAFCYAAGQYPGGSTNVPDAKGHSFFHNFLCDTMLKTTPNGAINTARPWAVFAHLILSATMIMFFYILPEIFQTKNRNTKLVRFFGMLTMTVFILMYTDYHDLIVVFTGILGSIALLPFFIELYRHKDAPLKTLAVVCYILSIIVFFIFVTKIGFYYLPALQKVTFVFDACWVVWVSLIVFKKRQKARE